MKPILTSALFALANLLTINNILAQDHVVRATIPFDFVVGEKLLPQGHYTIQQETPNTLLIRNRDDNYVAIMSLAHAAGTPSTRGKLVFNRYGSDYFLKEILCSSAAINLELPTSKLETRVQRREARLEGRDQTFIALK